MSRRFFLYDKNIFFSEGVRSLVDDLAAHDGDCAFSRLDQFSQLINTLRLPKQKRSCAGCSAMSTVCRTNALMRFTPLKSTTAGKISSW